MSIDEVAEMIRQAGSDRNRRHTAMSALYADEVVIAHEPPLPHDGPVPSSVLNAVSGEEVAAVERAMPDLWIGEPQLTVDGDQLRVQNSMGGSLADGAKVEVSASVVYTVREGRIVGLRSEMVPEDMQQWGAVLQAGNFQIPPDLLPVDHQS